jgi:polyhydroxyalkanoate synthesis regulator protein
MFEQAMRLFAPFGVTVPGQPASSSKTNDIADAADSPPEQSSMPSNAPASAPSHVKPMAPHEAMAQHQPAPQSTPMSSGGDDVQNKITALQRQLADLARGKA